MYLTLEQRLAYAQCGNRCPFCGGDDLYGGELEMADQQVWQGITCGSCDEEWTDVYQFVGLETQDELDAGVGVPTIDVTEQVATAQEEALRFVLNNRGDQNG